MNLIARIGSFTLLLGLALPAIGQTNYLETDDAIRELLIRVADRQLCSDATNRTPRTLADGSYPVATTLATATNATRPSGIEWTYTWGVNLYGLMQAYRATGNTNYLNFVRDHNLIVGRYYFWLCSLHNSLTSTNGLNTWQRTTALGELFRLDRLDFCGSMTHQMLECVLKHSSTNTFEQMELEQTTANWIAGGGQARLPDGTFWRPTTLYPYYTIWADDLYMACPFLLRWYQYTGDQRHLDDAALQIVNMAGYLQDTNGIWYHGYYVNSNQVNGIKWGRANGWAMIATTEVLDVMPTNHPARSNVLNILRRHIEGVKSVQQPSGMWRQILDYDNPSNWLETSCSAMFSYCIAHAANRGWIDATNMAVARKGFAGLSTNVTQYGEVGGTCEGTGIDTRISFYLGRSRGKDEMHGRGAVQLAAAEILMSPKLTIAAEDNTAEISWPAGIADDTLESSPDLANWTACTNLPTTTTNWLSLVTDPMTDAGFYRLRLAQPDYLPAALEFEAESLAWTTNGAAAVVSSLDTNASGGLFVVLNGDSPGDYIEFTITNVPAGDYRLKLNFKTDTNRGRIVLTVDGQPVGGALDEYWYATFYPLMDFGLVTFASAGDHTVRLTVSDKHGASAGYTVAADRFLLAPE
jgi:rhamnogalacturonyl hydrolase YesR